jgi:hypothetical protein
MSELDAGGGVGSRSASTEFSLMSGGLLDRLLVGARPGGAVHHLVGRTLLALLVVAWLPPFLLALIAGQAWGGVAIPFLQDIATQSRLLLAMPLLIVAEQVLRSRLRPSIGKFLERGIVPAVQRDEFEAALGAARKWLDSTWIDVFLLALAYAIGTAGLWHYTQALATDSWYGRFQDGQFVPAVAGWWFALVSLPLFQFLLLRWYFRLVVWWRLLARISRMDLQLQPLHADRVGGLGFMNDLTLAFAPFLMAQGALVSGRLADKIVFGHGSLLTYKFDIAAAIVLAVLLVLGPSLMFGMRLAAAKREALDDYGDLAMRYARDFRGKWLAKDSPGDESELGTGDIQSLADLGTSFGNVKDMLVVPFEMRTVLALVAAMALPLVPLLFTMFSPAELLARVVKLLM